VRLLTVLAAALALSGCSALSVGSSTTATSRPRTSEAAKVADANRTHEYQGPVAHQNAAGFPTQLDAVRVFATAYINWTPRTISQRMRALATISIGQARAAVALVASQSVQDYELKRGGVANSGTVKAVAPVLGAAREYAVVTIERTRTSDPSVYAGLRPAWHLALATVAPVRGGGWAVSSWQPES
jgi:hypothetical protein